MPDPNTITNSERKCCICRKSLYPVGINGMCFACERKEQIRKVITDEKVNRAARLDQGMPGYDPFQGRAR